MNQHDPAYQAVLHALNGQAPSPGKQPPEASQPKPPSQAEQLLQIAEAGTLFHSPDGKTFGTVPIGDDDAHVETLALRGQDFRNWLARRFYRTTDKAPSAKALHDARTLLEAKASYEGPCLEVFCRLGHLDDAIYLNLCNAQRQGVVIKPQGWTIIDQTPIRFRRTRGMLELPVPAQHGSLDPLRPFVNFGSEEDWRLIIAWLIAALRPQGPYPVLCLHGEQGSAKSTTAKVIRSLVDPSSAPLRSEPRNSHDLIIAASNSWVLAYDNLSHLPSWLSDCFCRLSTGGGSSTRALYTDDDEVIFDAQRPVILTGIEDLASRGDLMDRSLIIQLPTIAADKRQPEASFWKAFYEARPAILGALLDVVAGALDKLPTIQLTHLPRMADFELWVAAATPSLGWNSNDFSKAYEVNRQDANALTLEASPLVAPLRKFMDSPDLDGHDTWEGTASALLAALSGLIDEKITKTQDWPKNPRALSGALKRLAPNLRKDGLDIVTGLHCAGNRVIRITKGNT